MSEIRLAKDLALPLDIITQKIAILAVSGAGKTYTGKLIAEELLEHGQWPVIIDPVGVWWGLRSSADGTREGYPILILGGEHGDLPLDSHAGAIVAQFVIAETVPAILDISEWSNKQQTRFLTEFCNELFRLKKPTSPPLMLLLDEADQYAPQKPMPGEQELLGAWERIVRRGRAKGLGFTMITQRGAVLNKNVLTQIETLIALRNTSPQDSAAIRSWVEQHGTAEQTKELLSSLPVLENGSGWIWSPFWLKLFKRVHFRRARTFDSSATPKPGEKRIEPKRVAEIDLGKLEAAFASQVEEKRANDPALLRKRIFELERDKSAGASEEDLRQVAEREYQAGYEAGYKAGSVREHERLREAFEGTIAEIRRSAEELTAKIVLENTPPPELATRRQVPPPSVRKTHAPRRDSANTDGMARLAQTNGDLKRYDLRLLETLVERHPMRLNRSQLAALSGSSPKSSSFDLALKRLKDGGWMIVEGGRYEPTDSAFARLRFTVSAAPKAPADLLAMWKNKLPTYAGAILQALYEARGRELTRDEIGERIGRSTTSSSFDLAMKALKDNELISGERGVYSVGEVFR